MRLTTARGAVAAAVVTAVVAAAPARAQIRASEPASVSQTIDGTKLTIQYSRPRARGRATLFGTKDVVRWDEVRTPGANWATTLDASKDVTLEGESVPKDPYMGRFALIRVAPDLFTVGLYDEKGEIYEVLRPEMMLTFTRAGARATSFEVRDDEDKLWGTGARKP